MTRRLIRWSAAATVLIAALLLGIWLGRGPSVRPEDVRLEAILHHPGHGENLAPLGKLAWTMEIVLNKQGENALWTDDWSFAVTPIIGEMPANTWDFFHGQSSAMGGSPAGGDGFVVLRDESVRPSVARAMIAEGLNLNVQRWDKRWGFRYHGDSFPARIRYYLSGDENGMAMPEGIAVAYTHKERWLGRDLSWTKIIRAVPVAGAAEWKPDIELAAAAAFLPGKDGVLGRDEFGSGRLGELAFQRGQVLVWRPEPNGLATTAVFLKEDGTWMGGSNLTKVVHDPGLQIAVAADVNPVQDRERKVPLWAIFGQVTDPEIAYVLVVIPGESVSKMVQVEQGIWVRAHLGEIPGGEVRLEYMTRSFAVKARGMVLAERSPRP